MQARSLSAFPIRRESSVSFAKSLCNPAIRINAAITEERPPAARLLLDSWIADRRDNFLFIRGGFGKYAPERIGNKRVAEKLYAPLLISPRKRGQGGGGSGGRLEPDPVASGHIHALTDGMGAPASS